LSCDAGPTVRQALFVTGRILVFWFQVFRLAVFTPLICAVGQTDVKRRSIYSGAFGRVQPCIRKRTVVADEAVLEILECQRAIPNYNRLCFGFPSCEAGAGEFRLKRPFPTSHFRVIYPVLVSIIYAGDLAVLKPFSGMSANGLQL
jgi:hypothetical protein